MEALLQVHARDLASLATLSAHVCNLLRRLMPEAVLKKVYALLALDFASLSPMMTARHVSGRRGVMAR